MFFARFGAKALALPLSLGVPLAFALGLGAAACADDGESDCTLGTYACACFQSYACLPGLSCVAGTCVQLGGGEGETGPGDGDAEESDSGDGDGDPGDGDGDPSGDGDGDPSGDGDGDPSGDGDGDGDPSGDGDGDGDPGDPCGAGPEVLLYSQGMLGDGATGVLAGAYTDMNGSSVEVADDFTIPQSASCWCITRVVARGFYNDGILPANTPTFLLDIYNDGNTVPTGAPIVSRQGLLSADDEGELTATIAMDAVVPAGTYWLSFRPELEYAETIWYWYLTNTLPGDQAAVRDADAVVFDGLCTVWTPASACYGSPPDDLELTTQFDIIGVVGGGACN
jgi:hypothetical protein